MYKVLVYADGWFVASRHADAAAARREFDSLSDRGILASLEAPANSAGSLRDRIGGAR